MKYFRAICFLNLLLLIGALASAEPQDCLFKIESGLELSGQKLNGSGLVFHHKGAAYFLTSDHTVYPSGRGTRHRIFKDNYSTRAEFLMADWGRGFALLKLNLEKLLPIACKLTWDQLVAGRLQAPSQEAWVGYGYPAHSNEPQFAFSERPGALADSDLFFQVPQLFFSQGMMAEFGMSGGPVFTLESQQFVGVMSHIALSENENSEFFLRQVPSSQLVTIPFSDIQQPIANFLSGSNRDWNFLLPPPSGAVNVLETGHLSLIHWSPRNSNALRTVTLKYYPSKNGTSRTSVYTGGNGYLKRFEDFVSQRTKSGEPGLLDWFGEFIIVGYREKGSFQYTRISGGNRYLLKVLEDGKYEPVGVFYLGGGEEVNERAKAIYEDLQRWLSYQRRDEIYTTLTSRVHEFSAKFEPQDEWDSGWRPGQPSHWTDRFTFIGVRPKDVDYLLTASEFEKEWTEIGRSEELREILTRARDFLSTVTF